MRKPRSLTAEAEVDDLGYRVGLFGFGRGK